jgi:hypothetical protein
VVVVVVAVVVVVVVVVEVTLVVEVVEEDSAMGRSDHKHIHTWTQSNNCTTGTSYILHVGSVRFQAFGIRGVRFRVNMSCLAQALGYFGQRFVKTVT